MKPCCFKLTRCARSRQQETGVSLILVMVAIFMVVWIAVGAVGFSNVLRVKVVTQNAADAGVIGAMSLARNHDLPTVRRTAEEIARDNLLRLSAISNPDIQVIPMPLPSNLNRVQSISVDIVSPAQFALLGRLPGYPQVVDVTGVSTGTMRPVAISLVLDRSASMNASTPGDTVSKYGRLLEAIHFFVDQFTDGYDLISIVPFSTWEGGQHGDSKYDMQVLNKSAVHQFLDSLPAPQFGRITVNLPAHSEGGIMQEGDGMTNISAGVRAGVNQLGSPQIPTGAVRVMVVFTDGFPTRASFRSPQPQIPAHGDLLLPQNPAPGAPVCNPASYAPGLLSFRTDNHPQNAALILNAIVEGDRARSQFSASVYVVGLGKTKCSNLRVLGPNSQNPCGRGPLDPFQHSWAAEDPDQYIRSNFLARMANDRYYRSRFDDLSLNPNDPLISGFQTTVDFDIGCVPTLNDIYSKPQGEYFETPDAREIHGFFQTIASRIAVVLTR